MAVVESDQWLTALRRYNSKTDSTPFRELISRIPGSIKFVCMRCIQALTFLPSYLQRWQKRCWTGVAKSMHLTLVCTIASGWTSILNLLKIFKTLLKQEGQCVD